MKATGGFLMLLAVLLPALFLSSCEKKIPSDTAATGSAQFSFTMGAGAAKAGDSIATSWQLMVSIEDMNGTPVLIDQMVPAYSFGSGFISDKIEIKAGEYNLTKFLVIDPSGQVLFASPMEGSNLAYIAMDPLPVKFSVLPNHVTGITPEVIEVGSYEPFDFGYATFGIQIIKPLEFYVLAALDNPLVMAPTQITEADLTIMASDGWSYTYHLLREINHLTIRGSEYYTFVLSKEGYATQTLRFSSWDLINTTKENPLYLKIPWGPVYKTIVLQPGPADGKDAMISNLDPSENFGSYKYFEATFLTEPVLTVMRSNRSLIAFSLDSLPKGAVIQQAMLALSFDLPVPWDSTDIYFDPNGSVAGAVLQQIIEPWEENKVTWNNQPKTTEFGQVYLYPFIRNSNIIQLDVTSLFNNPSASALPNYGMLFRLWPDDKFPGFRFVSSDYGEAAMRPRLTISYSE